MTLLDTNEIIDCRGLEFLWEGWLLDFDVDSSLMASFLDLCWHIDYAINGFLSEVLFI